MKAFIFAAGIGSRLKPWTDFHPKALATVNGITLLERVIRKFEKNTEIDEIIVNLHHFPDQIKDFIFEQLKLEKPVLFMDETERLLDTGGALLKYMDYHGAGQEIIAHNVDILTDLNLDELINFHHNSKNDITLLVKQRPSERQLLFDSNMKLQGWKNLKSGEERGLEHEHINVLIESAFSGIQILNGKALNLLKTYRQIINNDIFSVIPYYLWAKNHLNIGGYLPRADYKLIDAGRPENLIIASKMFK